jgi:hypothetical protein
MLIGMVLSAIIVYIYWRSLPVKKSSPVPQNNSVSATAVENNNLPRSVTETSDERPQQSTLNVDTNSSTEASSEPELPKSGISTDSPFSGPEELDSE